MAVATCRSASQALCPGSIYPPTLGDGGRADVDLGDAQRAQDVRTISARPASRMATKGVAQSTQGRGQVAAGDADGGALAGDIVLDFVDLAGQHSVARELSSQGEPS
ncbi:hypothetical protein P4233_30965 [Pseudomonas aeruginosa]|nr:hypothetical protein [Pseudomonas aeruginosa]